MYNEELIEYFMPKLHCLATKYANEHHDEDELLSEGQIYLLEYLKDKQNVNTKTIKHNAYSSIDRRLKTFSSKPAEIMIDIETVGYDDVHPLFDSDALLTLLKTLLSNKEYSVIVDVYGFTGPTLTVEETAKKLHVTRERIKILRDKAELKIKNYFISQGLTCVNDLFI